MDCELVTIVQVIGMIYSTMGILSLIGKKHNSATANLLVANIATLA